MNNNEVVTRGALAELVAGIAQGALALHFTGVKSEEWAQGVADALTGVSEMVDTPEFQEANAKYLQ